MSTLDYEKYEDKFVVAPATISYIHVLVWCCDVHYDLQVKNMFIFSFFVGGFIFYLYLRILVSSV
jgi:hypothetical protein